MSLEAELIRQIKADGPMRLSDYMQLCLMHPQYGYYATRDPLGAKGDFTTAPEISQMFGELVGLCLAQAWMDQGGGPCILVELGPGRGTLMADMLRATLGVPGFHEGIEVHLVETSEVLRARQAETLRGYDVTWHARVEDLPDAPLFLVANEFFDALPIRQMVRDTQGWRERCIGLQDGKLSLGLGGPVAIPALEPRLADTKPGDIVEISPAACQVAEAIGRRINAFGGTALIIDYGDWGAQGDTFQAVKAHGHADPLAQPGTVDLTAHVDFEALARATPTAFTRLTPQGVFLERLGIAARAQALAAGLTGQALDAHIAAHRRLTHAAEMGTLFKVIGFYPDGGTPPPGLEP